MMPGTSGHFNSTGMGAGSVADPRQKKAEETASATLVQGSVSQNVIRTRGV